MTRIKQQSDNNNNNNNSTHDNNNTTPTRPTPIDNANPIVLVRHYQPGDHEQVRALFTSGMQSSLAAAWRSTCQSPPLAWSMLLLAAAVGWTVHTRQQQNQNSSSSLLLAVVASTATLAVSLASLWWVIAKGFQGYIDSSLQSDLRSPQQLQAVYGRGGGVFLVAVLDDNNNNNPSGQQPKVVGMVGAQPAAANTNTTKLAFELRRMSVDTQFTRRGIARQLIRQLERELPANKQQVFLTCSSIQYAAHGLYEKSGFTLKKQFQVGNNWLLKQGISFWRYEKEYTTLAATTKKAL